MGRQDAGLLSPADGVSDRAARYDAWFATPLGAAMDAAEARAVLALADPRPGERVLDAGCGTGRYARRLSASGATVTGVDTDLEMLASARLKSPSATLVEGDLMALPFAAASFELSVAVTVLCFLADPQRAVSELMRVTRPGGRVVLAELGTYSLWAAWRRVRGWTGSATWKHAHFFTAGALAGLLSQAGASDMKTAAAAYLPPGAPAWLLSHAPAFELHGSRLGGLGAAFVLARGEVSAP